MMVVIPLSFTLLAGKNKVPDRRRGNAYVRIINQYEASVLRFDGCKLVRRNKIGRHAKVAITGRILASRVSLFTSVG